MQLLSQSSAVSAPLVTSGVPVQTRRAGISTEAQKGHGRGRLRTFSRGLTTDESLDDC